MKFFYYLTKVIQMKKKNVYILIKKKKCNFKYK